MENNYPFYVNAEEFKNKRVGIASFSPVTQDKLKDSATPELLQLL